MKPKQVIERLKQVKDNTIKLSTYAEIQEPEDSTIQKLQEQIQALDHAINCVGAIEQIKWERDIAIQQLNELGYGFGEKIWYDMLEDKPKEEEYVLVQLDDVYYIAHYKGVVYVTDEKETEIWDFEDFEYTNDELEDFYKVHRWSN